MKNNVLNFEFMLAIVGADLRGDLNYREKHRGISSIILLVLSSNVSSAVHVRREKTKAKQELVLLIDTSFH